MVQRAVASGPAPERLRATPQRPAVGPCTWQRGPHHLLVRTGCMPPRHVWEGRAIQQSDSRSCPGQEAARVSWRVADWGSGQDGRDTCATLLVVDLATLSHRPSSIHGIARRALRPEGTRTSRSARGRGAPHGPLPWPWSLSNRANLVGHAGLRVAGGRRCHHRAPRRPDLRDLVSRGEVLQVLAGAFSEGILGALRATLARQPRARWTPERVQIGAVMLLCGSDASDRFACRFFYRLLMA